MTKISSAASRSRLPNTAEAGRASEPARDEFTLDLFAGLSEPAANGGEPAIAVASASIGEPIASASNAPANESEIEGVARGGDMPDIQRAETSSAVSTSASAAGSAAARSMKPRASKRRAQRRTIAEDVVKETEEVDAADAAPSAPVHIERPQDSTPEPQPAAAAQSAEAPAESVPPPVLDIPPPRDTTSDPLSLATFPGAGHMAADTPSPSALAEAAPVVERVSVWRAEATALHAALDETRRRMNRLRLGAFLAALIAAAALLFQYFEIVHLRDTVAAAQQRLDRASAAQELQQENLAQLAQRTDELGAQVQRLTNRLADAPHKALAASRGTRHTRRSY